MKLNLSNVSFQLLIHIVCMFTVILQRKISWNAASKSRRLRSKNCFGTVPVTPCAYLNGIKLC